MQTQGTTEENKTCATRPVQSVTTLQQPESYDICSSCGFAMLESHSLENTADHSYFPLLFANIAVIVA